ncbi:Calcium/calmodulin-dependent protein kinase type II subunit delta [Entophlyctis luteolus]|nr:Calcium/calmodulin-dependent protein kinase type II subunit delta [Entophlyctis luteolus]KAJ3350566.1 Calcium/calmodulin-dependent protein kinase type II subunit delta [Entophlyctis luteolus]KAJ3389436.1 Calcium/calmodulin-dependent protein kinase type II subunit delta [Entophlyctis sp. JEL0112]
MAPVPKKAKTEGELNTEQLAVLAANRSLLAAAVDGDWATYKTLVSEDLTCFEAEAGSHLVKGLDFHKFYFPSEPKPSNKVTTLVNPVVTFLSADKTAALCAYVRLTQFIGADGKPMTTEISETRIWTRPSADSNEWKNVHFQRGCGKL